MPGSQNNQSYCLDFDGHSVVIVGAGTGIGAEIARAFAVTGADLALTYYDDEQEAYRIAEIVLAAGKRAYVRELDCRSVFPIETFIDEALAALGTIDVFVYNAGLTDPHPFLELTEQQWDQTMDINLKGMFFAARRVAACLIEMQRPCSIVLLSSVQSIRMQRDHTHYAASKAAVNAMTRSLALQLAPQRIRVNAIAPGVIYVQRHWKEGLYDPCLMKEYIPLRRVGKPEDIANLALFLASDYSSYITGQVVVVDGGLTLPLGLPSD